MPLLGKTSQRGRKTAMNFQGILIGAAAFIIIGLFHPLVIRAEYHFGTRIWPLFFVVGAVALILSLFLENTLWSAILGVFGFSSLWSIREVFEQAERVAKGWFPRNPDRKP
jgi:hypothetical protein